MCGFFFVSKQWISSDMLQVMKLKGPSTTIMLCWQTPKIPTKTQKHCQFFFAGIVYGKILQKYKLVTQLKQDLGVSWRAAQYIKRSLLNQRSMWLADREAMFMLTLRGITISVCFLASEIRSQDIRKNIKYSLSMIQPKISLINTKVRTLPKKSYPTFAKLSPFWVIHLKAHPMDTCLCKLHENMQFEGSAFKDNGVLSSDDINKLVNDVFCSRNHALLYGHCIDCPDASVFVTKYMMNLCHHNGNSGNDAHRSG